MRTANLSALVALLLAAAGCAAEVGSGEEELHGHSPWQCDGPPGLYMEGSCVWLAPGVRWYQPRFALWSDGADKDRFVYLPPGTQIDTSNPDRWTFPLGTRLYKTFAHDGLRLETRVFEKVVDAPGPASWTMQAYAWSADQRSVTLVPPEGAQNVLGTDHDIPSQAQCLSCHRQSNTLDIANGFEAVQLNHFGFGVTLLQLSLTRRLTNSAGPPNVSFFNAHIPGNRGTVEALGYLHANCGHCHGGPTPRAGLNLSAPVGMRTTDDSPVYQTAVCEDLARWTGRVTDDGVPIVHRVEGGAPEESGIFARMSARGSSDQMPPLGTEFTDEDGLERLSDWIERVDGCVEETPPAE